MFEFSDLNVGPNVYTFLYASANVSAFSWPLTVRFVAFLKKSFESSTRPSSVFGILFMSSVVTLNISPAPSQSEPVIIGVFTYTNPLSWKNLWIAYDATDLTLKVALNALALGLR